MRKSARVLGSEFGLTAQEMNYLLKEQGFLDGEPGEYWPTEKGKRYAYEQHEHRGPGGYSRYNRDWTVRTWDESIVDELDLSEEAKEAARAGCAELSRVRREERASQYAYGTPPVPDVIDDANGGEEGDSNGELVVGALLLLGGFAWYKLKPKVETWWSEKAKPRIDSALARLRSNEPEAEENDDAPDDPR